VMTRVFSEESDLSTTLGSTPSGSSDGSRPSTDSDDESDDEDRRKAAGAARSAGFPAMRRKSADDMVCRRWTDPTHCQQFRAAENAQAVQQRRQTVGGGLCGNPDDFLTAPEVRLGSDGYVRQRTAEYERRIDFRKSLSENPPPLEEEEEEKEEESNRSSAAAGTALRRMGAEA